MPTRSLRLQLGLVLVASAGWAAWPHPSLAAWLGAYAAAWLAASLGWRFFVRRRWTLARGPTIALGLLLAAAPVARGVERWDALREHERLDGLVHGTRARLRLARLPSIAPPLVSADRPQTFYVQGEAESARAEVRFGPTGPRVPAEPLGHGLFRVEYDPRRHGSPDPVDGDLDAVLEIDGEAHTRRMLAVRPLAHPRQLATSPARDRVAAVSEETDELLLVERDGRSRRLDVDDGPTDVAWLSDARLLVTHRYADAALVELPSGARTPLSTGPLCVHVAARGALAALTCESAIVLVEGETVRRAELDFTPEHVAFGPGDTLVVSSRRPAALHRLRLDTLREDVPPLSLGRPAVTLAAAEELAVVAVTDFRPEGPPHLGNHFVDDQLLEVDLARWRIRGTRHTATRTARQRAPGDVDRGVSPMGIDLAADGRRWVAFAGTDDVWGYAAERLPVMIALEDTLPTPISVARLEGARLAVASAAFGAIGIFTEGGRRVALARFAPDDDTLMRDDEPALMRRIGERSFHESTRSGVSCQSCHLHGGSDGQRHNIGGGTLVATLDARGALGTPPFLRDGGYPTLGSLDELARTLYRGYLRRQGGRRVGLARYLASAPREIPSRQLRGRDAARERRGFDAFVRARCPLCHTPPAFTNLGQHPAETLFPDFAASHPGYELDTPSLFGLEGSAPYLVDGRAESLRAIFEAHDPERRHGDFARLSPDAQADLLHFLGGL